MDTGILSQGMSWSHTLTIRTVRKVRVWVKVMPWLPELWGCDSKSCPH